MRVEVDGKFFRLRRGKLVEIPAEWLNKVTTSQTIRKRSSKLINKVARQTKRSTKPSFAGIDYIDGRHDMIDGDA